MTFRSVSICPRATTIWGSSGQKGEVRQALKSFLEARVITEKLVSVLPNKPRYREALAGTLTNLALAQELVEPDKAEQTYQQSISIFEKLIADYPEMSAIALEWQMPGQFWALDGGIEARRESRRPLCSSLRGPGHEECVSTRRGTFRQRIVVLNNLGEFRLSMKRPQAEKTLREAIGVIEKWRHARRRRATIGASFRAFRPIWASL